MWGREGISRTARQMVCTVLEDVQNELKLLKNWLLTIFKQNYGSQKLVWALN